MKNWVYFELGNLGKLLKLRPCFYLTQAAWRSFLDVGPSRPCSRLEQQIQSKLRGRCVRCTYLQRHRTPGVQAIEALAIFAAPRQLQEQRRSIFERKKKGFSRWSISRTTEWTNNKHTNTNWLKFRIRSKSAYALTHWIHVLINYLTHGMHTEWMRRDRCRRREFF